MHANTLGTKDASTVILVSGDSPFEVYLMQRAASQTFMAGAYVFPGGQVDTMDINLRLLEHCHGFTPVMARDLLQETELEDEIAIGLFFGAIRELFEESGILLAYGGDHKLLGFQDHGMRKRFYAYRSMLHRHEITLLELASTEKITYAPELLIPYSHWITPRIEGKRFDTRFFLTHVPLMQAASQDNQELVKSMWMKPCVALSEHMEKKIVLMPPTLKTMEELGAYSSREELFTYVRTRLILPILPEPFFSGAYMGVKLPHDPDYTIEDYKQEPRHDEPSRIIMRDGDIWKLVSPVDETGERNA